MSELEILKMVFDSATGTPIGEKLTTFMVAWYFVRKTIKGHFSAIEKSLEKINDNLGDLKDTMEDLEASHSVRLEALEEDVKSLKERQVTNGDEGSLPA